MFPAGHVIFGIIFSAVLYLGFSFSFFGIIIVFLSSVFIDLDHYICYIVWKKDFSLKNSYEWFAEEGKRYDNLSKEKKKEYTLGIFPLHSIEVLLAIFLLSFLNNFFIYIFLGFAFHIICDFIWEILHAKRAMYRFLLIYSVLHKWPKN